MPSLNQITVPQLLRLIGTPQAPMILDVRIDEDVAQFPRRAPAARRIPWREAERLAPRLAGQKVVVACHRGQKLSEGVAALLRSAGVEAETLEGGMEAWRAAEAPTLPLDLGLTQDADGQTLWVTRHRPKIDRIACPWLIRRFVDRGARFLFVAPSEVAAVAEKFGATPFDIEGVRFSHRGALCSFDVMLDEFELTLEPLRRLALIVRGADTSRHDLAPECAGLLAASLGLSRMYRDDLQQLEAGLGLYDAFYRWARDAVDETHDWPSASVPDGGHAR